MPKNPLSTASLVALALAAGCAAEPARAPTSRAPHGGVDIERAAPRRREGPPPGPLRLTIEDVRARARTASERVLEAEANVRKAKAHEDATFDEVFLPKVDVRGGYVRTDRRLAIETRVAPIQIASRDLSSDIVKATQPLLDLSGFFFRTGAERAGTEVARLALERAADLAELEAVGAFYAALTLAEEVAAVERSIAALRQRVEDSRNLQKAGLARENDVTKVELELLRREQALLAARHREREARLDLLAALACPVDAPALLVEPAAPAAPAPPLPALVARALSRRADLRALDAASRRLEAVQSALVADYLPRIAGFADWRYDYNKVYNEPEAVEVGVELEWRVFDGFARDERRAEAEAEREAVRARRRDLERRVAVEVERATLLLEEERSALVVAETSMKQAESSLRIEENLYRRERSTVSDLLEAEQRLFESRVEAARARYGALGAAAALRSAVGGD